jgi:hypothetical protein
MRHDPRADDYNYWYSYGRELAYANAFVEVLRNAGIDAWYTSRLD